MAEEVQLAWNARSKQSYYKTAWTASLDSIITDKLASTALTIGKSKQAEEQSILFWMCKIETINHNIGTIIGKTTTAYFKSLYNLYTTASLPTDSASTAFEDAALKFIELEIKAQWS
ncbi:hypothetical protein C0995_002582 [Termitomyces sp. Mi166|nr:hypothetical protein C0995_002582 [Termitomyces sp. Mi166\